MEYDLELEFDIPDKHFKLHQCYEKPNSLRIPICKRCKKSDFDVGCGSYYTALRCRECGTECCVHDG